MWVGGEKEKKCVTDKGDGHASLVLGTFYCAHTAPPCRGHHLGYLIMIEALKMAKSPPSFFEGSCALDIKDGPEPTLF